MADFDKSKFDPKAATEARKQEMDQMAQKLEAGCNYVSVLYRMEGNGPICKEG